MNKSEELVEMKRSQKVLNWTLFVLLTFVVIAGAGVFVLQNQDKLNAEILEGVQKAETIKEKVVPSTAKIDVDKEANDLDAEINKIADDDFADAMLNDTNLSL